jgi:hypothetical protein
MLFIEKYAVYCEIQMKHTVGRMQSFSALKQLAHTSIVTAGL